ncbi:MAG: TadE/TadG family type IV pilus assembly protein [Dehalococcoidia bacterium]
MLGIVRRITRRRGKKEGGQSLVEFALVLPIFLLVLFAIVDFGMAFHAWITVTNSAREGARLGSVRAPASEIEQRVRDTAGSLGDDVAVTVSNAQGNPGDSVVVEVSYVYSLITPLADVVKMFSAGSLDNSFTLSSTADMRLE